MADDIVERLREALAAVQDFRGDLDSDEFNDACALLRVRASQASPVLLARLDEQVDELACLRAALAKCGGDHCMGRRVDGVTQWVTVASRDAAVRAALAQPQWQPIETAPKDGSKVMLTYLNRCCKRRTVLAAWLTQEAAEDIDHEGVGLEAGWFECIDNWPDYTDVAIHEGEPTHWMPLPAPPQASAHPDTRED